MTPKWTLPARSTTLLEEGWSSRRGWPRPPRQNNMSRARQTCRAGLISLMSVGAACGGVTEAPSGAATVTGTFDGVAMPVSVACGTYLQCAAVDPNVGFCGYISVVISSRGVNTCEESSNFYARSEQLVFSFATIPTAGVYEVAYQGATQAFYMAIGANCGGGREIYPDTGTITVAEVSATRIAGSYSLNFGTDGEFSGTFDVPIAQLPPHPIPLPPVRCIP